ncbi:hypothetical protein BGZ65_008173 [Modicella reniformis]|uniref:Uncharacterized protein n=1 Tax=Modicella reniformis TaxID=1440133 RepID=A0A9P6SSC0_9FUNG|nr:hypothetical protein BGZ65_008173 [Modicella reniformis]
MTEASTMPFNQFCFFKSLSYSLFEDDWVNMVESWQAMVAVNAPIPEFSYNMTPFFANAPRLLPVFHRYMAYAEQDPELLPTLTTVLMSTPLLIKVQNILQSTELFAQYVVALKLDNPSASHTQVMQSLQNFLSGIPENKRLQIQKVFAEEEASDSMGLTPAKLNTALQLLHADTQLYIDILSTLQLNQIENLPWQDVVTKIKTLVSAKKPQALPGVEQFLQSLHCISSANPGDMDAENDDDDILRMVEGVDYYPDEDEEELGPHPEGEDYDQHFAAFLQDVQEGQSAHNFADDFGKMAVTDSRHVVESC